MGCAREGGVGTEVRVVGYFRQISPNFGVAEIGVYVWLSRPRGTTKSSAVLGELDVQIPPGQRLRLALTGRIGLGRYQRNLFP